MKKLLCLIALIISVPCLALEKNTNPALCFGNKYKLVLDDGVSMGFAYSDKRLVHHDQKRFAQKWGVGLDFKVTDESRFGLRLGYDDAGKTQRNAVGLVWGKTF